MQSINFKREVDNVESMYTTLYVGDMIWYSTIIIHHMYHTLHTLLCTHHTLYITHLYVGSSHYVERVESRKHTKTKEREKKERRENLTCVPSHLLIRNSFHFRNAPCSISFQQTSRQTIKPSTAIHHCRKQESNYPDLETA